MNVIALLDMRETEAENLEGEDEFEFEHVEDTTGHSIGWI